jgi:hypothetical protein
MTRLRIYCRPDSPDCLRRAHRYLSLDWLHRVVLSTATPPGGPLAVGETVVQDLDTGRLVRGAAAFDCLCKHIPLYLPMRLLLRIPPIWRKAEQTMAGLGERANEQRRQITRRWR